MPDDHEPDREDGAERSERDVVRLLEHLRDRDAACPVCGYNLRDLTAPRCPECRHELELSVGARHVRLLALMLTVAPSMFSGIAAVLLSVPVIAATVLGQGPVPGGVLCVLTFGWISGITGVLLVRHRHWFLGLEAALQRHAAIGAWMIHVLAFAMLVTIAALS